MRLLRGALLVFRVRADQRAGDDAVHAVRAGQGDERAGQFAHEAAGAAAVDEGGVGGMEGVGEGTGGGEVGGILARAGCAARRQVGVHRMPVVLVNVDGYWDGLVAWVRRAVEEGFVGEGNARILVEVKDTAEVLAALREYRVAEGRFDLDWSQG